MATAVGFGKPEQKRLAKELSEKCAELFAHRFGLEPRQAQKAAKRLVKEAQKTLAGQPLMQQPPRRGRRLLDGLRKTPKGLARWEALQREGVREPDFIRWWDHHVLEQEVMRRVDAFEQEQFLHQFAARNLPPSQAQHVIHLQCPLFGRPNSANHTIGSHVPLPYELRPRVQVYMSQTNPDELRNGAKRCMSMNAYLRELIQSGEL